MNPELLDLIPTSIIPSDAQRARISQLLTADRHWISVITNLIKQLVLERDGLERNVTTYEAILSLVRNLTDDVLREIFMQCLPVKTLVSTSGIEANRSAVAAKLNRNLKKFDDLPSTLQNIEQEVILKPKLKLWFSALHSQHEVTLCIDFGKKTIAYGDTIPGY
ncbi:hypothetical protein C8J56DRAFT_1113917 [Mycena floridula]|nr:hypothetical protein C8J56DRAFT_1119005 [Mycena floridula]KAJ7577269.1 hypothetical protein C8J56DRAFT_1113917 [Mycena floridula]